MSFHNVRLPERIESGARGGIGFNTGVLEASDGSEQRNVNWARARGRWDIAYGIRDKADLIAVKAFHVVRHGKAYGFRFRDWSDYVMTRQTIAVGDGVATLYPVFKEYVSGDWTYRHYLTRIVSGTFSLWVNGVLMGSSVDYGLDIETGAITFNGAPPTNGHIIEFACLYDHPARFDIDRLDIQAIIEHEYDTPEEEQEGIEALGPIPIVSLKERIVGLGES